MLVIVHRRTPLLLAALLTLILLSVAALTNPYRHPPLLEISNFLGPAANSLLHHRGLDVCGGGKHTGYHCLQGERMPLAPITIAALYAAFHSHALLAGLTKSFVFLLPALAAFTLAWRHAHTERARYAATSLFAFALLLPPMLNVVINLNFEEAYAYSWLALGFSLALFPESLPPRTLATLTFLACAVTYLTKSSLLLVSAALVLSVALWLAIKLRERALATTLLTAFLCVPLLWGTYQHHATGRFTVGTSLDGLNFYKGNNASFLDHYPPPGLSSLDEYDTQLLSPLPSRADAWATSDFCRHAALAYIRANPANTFRAALRKASVFFLRIHRDGGDGVYTPLVEFAYSAGLLLFRLGFLIATALAITRLRNPRTRFAAIIFLTTALCAALPYLAGFALTRHALILILPTALYLSRAISEDQQPESSSARSASATSPS